MGAGAVITLVAVIGLVVTTIIWGYTTYRRFHGEPEVEVSDKLIKKRWRKQTKESYSNARRKGYNDRYGFIHTHYSTRKPG